MALECDTGVPKLCIYNVMQHIKFFMMLHHLMCSHESPDIN